MQPDYKLPEVGNEEVFRAAAGNSTRESVSAWARKQYRKARWRSTISAVAFSLLGVDNRLQEFDRAEYGNSLLKWQYIGLRSVPIREIRGSECGADQFDRYFRPLAKASKDTWLKSMIDLVYYKNFQPAEVIKLEDGYIVQNGIYRISAASCLGSTTYLAYVTGWEMLIEQEADQFPVERQETKLYVSTNAKNRLISNRLLQCFTQKDRKEVASTQNTPHYTNLFYGLKF